MTNDTDFRINEINIGDRKNVSKFIAKSWGSSLLISRGKIYNIDSLHGFICKENDKIVGLITYHIENQDCEIVTLDSKIRKRGLGTKLINKVLEKAKNIKCKRVWLITTNDNTNAIRFYQRFGFEWIGFHKDAMKESRKIKPEIPKYGDDNIPIKHELEFEIKLKQKN